MKIYTRTGDAGETGLFGGPRVPKDDSRIEAYGNVDELNATIGLVLCESLPSDVSAALIRIQHHLFDLGAELATPDAAGRGLQLISNEDIAWQERLIDGWDASLPLLRVFILPGGCKGAALLHVARCVCRRAERGIVTLARNTSLSENALTYINRLSDLLFVMARFANLAASTPDVPWQKRSDSH